jgi:hypothetical protein
MNRRLNRTKPMRFGTIAFCLVALVVTLGMASASTAQGLATLDVMLAAHKAWPVAPVSVEMTGTSTRNGVSAPFRITATRAEEVLTEYEDLKQVNSPVRNFKDDGKAMMIDKEPAGFGHLDVTGPFFLAQLLRRTVEIGTPQKLSSEGSPAYRIHVRGTRSQVHYVRLRVNDEFDLYTYDNGMLAAIQRVYYPGDPACYIADTLFSDYRETGKDGPLLPYRIQVYRNAKLVETLTVSQYQFDLPTPTSLFLPRRSK